jgi:enterochelin esterase-like enzyme
MKRLGSEKKERNKNGKRRKVLILLVIIFALLAAFITGYKLHVSSKKQDAKEKKTASESADPEGESFDDLDLAEGDIGLIETVTYPDSYTEEEASQQGSIQEISYTVDALGNAAESGDAGTYEKSAIVYLPYGYSEENQYNIIYLAHGMGGTQYTFPGKPGEPESSDFKKLVDHMIEDDLMEPVIIVFPTITPSVSSNDEEYEDKLMSVMQNEYVSTLIPLMESTFSTYAESTDKAGLLASRDHRCMSGFSMGGCLTWRMLWHETGYFRYYLPFSMVADYHNVTNIADTSQFMYQDMQAAGYSGEDFEIYCASGTKDYTNLFVREQVNDLLEYSDLFTYTSTGWEDGNLMYAEWPGHYHRYYESYPYFFCGFLRTFPTEKTSSYMQDTDAATRESEK